MTSTNAAAEDVGVRSPVVMDPQTVPVAAVLPHPGNPRHDLGDLEELKDSIAAVGILQPPIALPADRVAKAWPQHADTLAGADWVVLMGHRRLAAYAALTAGDPSAELQILVRTDAIADDRLAQLDAMVTENVARKPMTPVEEARAFAEQAAAGRSQRRIAQRAGCSQGHVSKRLALLELPPALLLEVERDALSVTDALGYIKAAGDDQDLMLAAHAARREHEFWAPGYAVDWSRRERERLAQVDAARARVDAEGLKVIDAHTTFGNAFWEHRLEGRRAIDRARAEGTLVAEIGLYGDVRYYSTSKPKRLENISETRRKTLDDERGRRTAMKAREAAAAVLAAKSPRLPESAAGILDAYLWAPGNDAATLAYRWLTGAGVGPRDPELPQYRWWQKVRRGAWPLRVHAAHALSLAWRESQARATYRKWTAEDATWIQMLIDQAGYVPTEWERQRLAAIEDDPDDDADPPGDATSQHVLAYDPTRGWCLRERGDQEPTDTAGPDITEEQIGDAQRWAQEILAASGRPAVTWREGGGPDGTAGYIATATRVDDAN